MGKIKTVKINREKIPKFTDTVIAITKDDVNELLGLELDEKEIKECLEKMLYKVSGKGNRISVHVPAPPAMVMQRFWRPAPIAGDRRKMNRSEMIFCTQCNAVQRMGSEQRHIDQVLGAGNALGQISGSGPRVKGMHRVPRRSDTSVARQSRLNHKSDILEFRIRIVLDLIEDRIADIS